MKGAVNIIKYRAIDLNGNKIKGKYESNNIEELNNILRKSGYFLLKINKEKNILENIHNGKAGYKEISIICRGLSSMLSAGITITKAINIVAFQCNKKSLRESLNNIERNLSKGESLYNSFKRKEDIYPLFMVEMINIGEISGRLDQVLEKLSQYYEKEYRTRMKIRSALCYPTIILFLSINITFFLMIEIVPEFMKVLESSGGEVPIITEMMLQLCILIKTNFFSMAISLFIFLTLVYFMYKKNKFKTYLDKFKIKIPIIRTFYNRLLLIRISNIMSILLYSGFTIIKTLEVTNSVLDNSIVKKKLYECTENIKNGESIYSSFHKYCLGNNLFLSMVKIGEEAGNLDYMLSKVQEILEDELEENLKKLVTLVEPITIVLLAAFVGIFVIAGFLPIVNIMDSIN
ncbi:type II secretion system F family protein [Clostridium sp. DJ247]|uniref:type II secretion system F family protein n=1 Tax=Clostridium sp. DJ247 TaxID=2726188 RepID=UPI00162342EE|nr:type II secretion system F family protein [Clostridium sp. DJ247]MBC2580308.1 type II secretion system F family protein [Clostridium sp. DJ247]